LISFVKTSIVCLRLDKVVKFFLLKTFALTRLFTMLVYINHKTMNNRLKKKKLQSVQEEESRLLSIVLLLDIVMSFNQRSVTVINLYRITYK